MLAAASRSISSSTGNPDTTDDIDIVIGTSTVVINGEGLIATAGAYGHAMGSRYNLREPAEELMLEPAPGGAEG